jgi:hypothetical protein
MRQGLRIDLHTQISIKTYLQVTITLVLHPEKHIALEYLGMWF